MGKVAWKFGLDSIIGFSAVFVSVLALFLTMFQMAEQRHHDKLSVQPIVQIVQGFKYENGSGSAYITAINEGFGVAIVKGSKITFEGRIYDPIDDAAWEEIINQIGTKIKLRTQGDIYNSEFVHSVYLRPSDEENYLVKFVSSSKADLVAFMEKMKDAKLEICYCSIYDDCWTAKWQFNKKIGRTNVENVPGCKGCE